MYPIPICTGMYPGIDMYRYVPRYRYGLVYAPVPTWVMVSIWPVFKADMDCCGRPIFYKYMRGAPLENVYSFSHIDINTCDLDTTGGETVT